MGLFSKNVEAQECELHHTHRPRNRTVEEHHVVPQAWQKLWGPSLDWHLGVLWHKETVTICPTGHRNVHFWLVEYMQRFAQTNEIPILRKPTTEQMCAQDGMLIFQQAGGNLAFLCNQHAFGYA